MRKNKARLSATEEIGNYLRVKREAMKITQIELADKLGYATSQFVSNWERGLCRPPSDRLKQIVKLLKINRSEFLKLIMDVERREWESLI